MVKRKEVDYRIPVDVLTVTKRTGWEARALETLNQQTFKRFRWIIVTEGRNEFLENFFALMGNTRREHLLLQAPPKRFASNLNTSLNWGLKHVRAPLVLFYQDFIDLQPNTLQLLYDDARDCKKFVSTCTINPDGRADDRYTGLDELRPCTPGQWEANVAIAPMKAVKELGGFDEEYDKGWSWDNVNLAERAAMLGYEFYVDERVRPQLLFHTKEPDLHPDIPLNGDRHAQTMQDIVDGKRPIKNQYL